jgi:hypothetical protein
MGASYKTNNFVVNAPTAELAKQVGEAAEIYRKELAIEWTGKPLPGDWSYPCPITVVVGNMGAGGKTTFNFQKDADNVMQVYGWKMEIKGSEQRILDSVLPHEINHTIFASVFRRPLPRWADEGAASLIEHESERNQLRQIHSRAMQSRRKISLKKLLEIKDYPQDQQEILTLYAEGHSLADFLIQKGDKPTYLKLLQTAHERGWETALNTHYGYSGIDKLEGEWDQWVVAGSPSLNLPAGTQIASNDRKSDATIRGQSPSSDLKLSESVSLAPREKKPSGDLNESIAQGEPKTVAQVPILRDRTGLSQPLLTIDRVTTDAAKVSRNKVNLD